MKRHELVAMLVAMFILLIASCSSCYCISEISRITNDDYTGEPPEVCTEGLMIYEVKPTGVTKASEDVCSYPARYTEEDVYTMAVMLAGECYPCDEPDMRNAAITVCNRVDDPQWHQDSVTKVIQQTGFYGYEFHYTPTETNLSVARQVLDDWSAISAGYERPWQPWLYFSAEDGVNVYRVVY